MNVKSSKTTTFSASRASAEAVDFENLLENSFNDNNTSKSSKANVIPRWERKKLQKQAALLNTNTNACSDRFIPSRSGMELASFQLRSCNSSDEIDPEMEVFDERFKKTVTDEKKDVYASNLSTALLGIEDVKNCRILSYQDKAPVPVGDTVNNLNVLYSASSSSSATGKNSQTAKLVSRHIPSAPSRILDAPDLMDDYYLNLVSWNDQNVLAIALGQVVYCWNAATGDIDELCTFEEGINPHISSVAWVQQGGTHLAVGVSNGHTQLWDVAAKKQLRSMDGHTDRVGTLAWNRHILTSGSKDSNIIHHDVRVARHNVATLSGVHEQEVCGLAWSSDGETLASGGNDNLLCLWDASASTRSQPRFRLTDHHAAVKALAWSPHERNLLASGAGSADRCIKFWNASTGCMLNSIDTGSQVCSLLWNPYEKEILSSHGFTRNQLTLWKYPSMAKIKEFEGHTARVLHMACGPDGTVLSAAADETLRFWDMFAPPPTSTLSSTSTREIKTTHASSKSNWTMQIR